LTTWAPDTCHCIAEWTEPFDDRQATLIQRCRTHDTFNEMRDHNNALAMTFGRDPTDSNKDTMKENAILERAKFQFQRR